MLDTNVVVSGLLCAHGHPARLLDPLLDGRLRLAFDDRIEAEYREVLARPRLAIPAERTLITGSLRHFPVSARGIVTGLSPREAWQRLIRAG